MTIHRIWYGCDGGKRVRGPGAEDLVEVLDVNPVQREGWILTELLRKALAFTRVVETGAVAL